MHRNGKRLYVSTVLEGRTSAVVRVGARPREEQRCSRTHSCRQEHEQGHVHTPALSPHTLSSQQHGTLPWMCFFPLKSSFSSTKKGRVIEAGFPKLSPKAGHLGLSAGQRASFTSGAILQSSRVKKLARSFHGTEDTSDSISPGTTANSSRSHSAFPGPPAAGIKRHCWCGPAPGKLLRVKRQGENCWFPRGRSRSPPPPAHAGRAH